MELTSYVILADISFIQYFNQFTILCYVCQAVLHVRLRIKISLYRLFASSNSIKYPVFIEIPVGNLFWPRIYVTVWARITCEINLMKFNTIKVYTRMSNQYVINRPYSLQRSSKRLDLYLIAYYNGLSCLFAVT